MVYKKVYYILLVGFTCAFVPTNLASTPHRPKFSDEAWDTIAPIYKAIVEHPFNQELQKGTLPSNKFDYYTWQDSLYLEVFTKSLILLSIKIDDRSDSDALLKLARNSVVDEVEMHERRLSQHRYQSSEMSPATLMYSNYLLMLATLHTKEELAAALLPCFWIYLKVAEDMKKRTSATNPYIGWINMYSSNEYRRSVQFMRGVTDKLAASADQKTRSKMMKAFVMASRLEWYFWEGAYQLDRLRPYKVVK